MASIPCPFVYANGKSCRGEVVRVEAYKADVAWEQNSEGEWEMSASPRTHFHLFCSEKGNHAGYQRQDDPRMKLWGRDLPEELQRVIGQRSSL